MILLVWHRYARIQAIWRCLTLRGYYSKFHAVGVAIRDEYDKKPVEDINEWVRRLGMFVVRKMCENSCQSLSTSVFCDYSSLDIDVRYTSQTLVGEKKPPVVERKMKAKVPMYVLEQIKFLENKRDETKTKKGKDSIQVEINRIKERYGIE